MFNGVVDEELSRRYSSHDIQRANQKSIRDEEDDDDMMKTTTPTIRIEREKPSRN